ncbi:AraC family transcriptional regulator [Chitinophaga sancti]|uniref:helix-turn-helix domain-containing protein n=1 Tax=Chitinophaga sancti TaxID=1004 RepID=UPI002A764957|nr:AraC family transcriptional regulator [Chitinophaga sancti]WPQ63392.1 AraC family transcriptional regulator [Chitinophaga sancti]
MKKKKNTSIKLNTSLQAWKKIEEIKELIDELHRQNVYHLTIRELSLKFFMSKSLITKTFRLRYHTSVHQYIIKQKMEYAKILLLNNREQSITKIAEKLGYSLSSNFTRDFKKHTGNLPLQFSKSAFLSKTSNY